MHNHLPSIFDYLSLFYEELGNQTSKLPTKKGNVLTVTAGSDIANDIETDVFDMIQKSYAKIGGHAKISTPNDMGGNYPSWTVSDVDDDPEPDVVKMNSYSKETGGLKSGASGTDGSAEAKKKLLDILKTFYSTPGNWGEVSGAVANILIKKLGFKPIEDPMVVKKLLPGKNITWMGAENPEGDNLGVSGWYTRKIGNHEHAKIIVGTI